jgi:uncharacterized membrane protein YjjP (DUF1212 family)
MVHEVKKERGFTVSELEAKMRKFGIEATLCGAFLLSAIFALLWSGKMLVWSILLTGIGGIVGTVLPKMIHKTLGSLMHFCTKERVTATIVAILMVLLSIFVPFVIFAIVGTVAGKSLAAAGHKAFGHDLLKE